MGLMWPDAAVMVAALLAAAVALAKLVPRRANGAERRNAERQIRMEVDISYLRLDLDRVMSRLEMLAKVRPMNLKTMHDTEDEGEG
jgi:hypothetical protein